MSLLPIQNRKIHVLYYNISQVLLFWNVWILKTNTEIIVKCTGEGVYFPVIRLAMCGEEAVSPGVVMVMWPHRATIPGNVWPMWTSCLCSYLCPNHIFSLLLDTNSFFPKYLFLYFLQKKKNYRKRMYMNASCPNLTSAFHTCSLSVF